MEQYYNRIAAVLHCDHALTHWRRLDVAPVVRYTHWAQDIVPVHPVSERNQVELLDQVDDITFLLVERGV